MNNEELKFILKMRDEASAVLSNVGMGFDRAGKEAKSFSQSAQQADQSLNNVISTAKQAAVALSGIWASSKLFSGAMSAFSEYEQGMLNVKKTTNMSAEEMEDFKQAFTEMSSTMAGIDRKAMLDIAGAAGQLGIKGRDNILAFTETMSMLGVATDIVGRDGAKSFARFLALSKETAQSAGRLGAVINQLGNNFAADESEILKMSMTLAQATARFEFGADKLLGLGAAAAQLNMRPELFATTTQRSLGALFDAATNNTKGMQQLSAILGTTDEEFKNLINTNPAQALTDFYDVLGAINADGQSMTGFLAQFQLQGQETQRVLGTMAQNADLARNAINMALTESGEAQALRKEYSSFIDGLEQNITWLKNAFKDLGTFIFGPVAEDLKDLVKTAKEKIDGIRKAFVSLSPTMQKVISYAALIVPPLIAAIPAVRLLGAAVKLAFGFNMFSAAITAIKWVGKGLTLIFGQLGIVRLAFSGLAKVAIWAGGAIVGAIGAIPLLIAAAVAAIIGIGLIIWKYWDDITSWLGERWDAFLNIFEGGWSEILPRMWEYWKESWLGIISGLKRIFTDFWDWLMGHGEETVEVAAEVDTKEVKKQIEELDTAKIVIEGHLVEPTINKTYVEAMRGLSDEQRDLIDKFDTMGKAMQEVADIEAAIAKLKTLQEASYDYRDKKQLAMVEAKLEAYKETLAPLKQQIKEIDKELEKTKAVTGEQKAQLEITEAIRAATEQLGILEKEELALLTSRTQELQKARQLVAFDEVRDNIQDDIDAARAVTVAAKDELEVRKRIRDLNRENIAISKEQEERIRRQMETLRKTNRDQAFTDLMESTRRELQMVRATTAAEKEQLQIRHQIADFEKSNGEMSTVQRRTLVLTQAAKTQMEAFNSLKDTLDPVGAATREYGDNVATLNRALGDGTITLTQYQQLLATLQQTTQAARDPFASQIKNLRRQMDLAKVVGDYREADKKTIQSILDMQDKGLTVSREQIMLLAEANRQLQDIEKTQSSGLHGWMNSIGSMRDNLLDLTKDFASEMSKSIVGAFTDGKSAMENFFKNMANKLLEISVNQALKGLLTSMTPKADSTTSKGGFLSKLFGDIAGVKPNDNDIASIQSLTAQTMPVTAAQVIINGSVAAINSTPALGNSRGVSSNNVSSPPVGRIYEDLAAANQAIQQTVAGAAASAVDNATRFLNMHEVKNGSALNSFMRSNGVNINAAQTAWCAGFVNANLNAMGLKGSGSLVANSFLGWGMPVEANQVAKGDVLVKHNGKGYNNVGGHVGFATGNSQMTDRGLMLEMLSGNQGNRVQKTWEMADGLSIRRGVEQQMAQANQQITQASQKMQELGQSMQVAGQNSQTLGQNINQAGSAAQQAGTNTQNSSQAFNQAGQNAQNTGSLFTQAGTLVQQAGEKVRQVGQSVASSVPSLSNFTQGVNNVGNNAAQASQPLSGFNSILGSLLQQLLGGLGGGAGGGMGGIFSSLLGAFFHSGGKVGSHTDIRPISLGSLPRFHKGNSLKGDEFLSVLQKGERVLTERQEGQTLGLIKGLANSAVNNVSNVFAPQMSIKVEGDSKGEEADQKLAARLSHELDLMLKAKMSEFAQENMRNGGLLNQGKFA